MNRKAVAAILWDRPYHPWHLMPLACYLWSRGYYGSTRNRVVDAVASGTSLVSLVDAGLLGPADVAGCSKVFNRRMVA